MKDEIIYGKILDLTKHIYLKQPDEPCWFHQFLSEKGFGFGGAWWLTKKSTKLLDDISEMIIEQLGVDEKKDHLNELIQKLLRRITLNSNLIDFMGAFTRNAKTLFEARQVEHPQEFARRVWLEIKDGLQVSILKWLFFYPLHRVRTTGISLGYNGLHLIPSEDIKFWLDSNRWDPRVGKIITDKAASKFGSPSAWLLCEANGTEQGARRLAGRHMRMFISALLSFQRNLIPSLLNKSNANAYSYSLQFSDKNYVYASIGALFPRLLADIEISDEIIAEIKDWYKVCWNNSKVIAAANFINYGIMTDELERFIHFFIGLDALFGERDKVESTVTGGIRNTFPNDNSWGDRAKYLFDIRCELVHGGIFEINDWKGMTHYQNYFGTHPMRDIEVATLEALKKYAEISTRWICLCL